MNKKKIISLLLAICMLFTLAACGETNEDSLLSNSDEPIDEPIDEPVYFTPLPGDSEDQLPYFIALIFYAFETNDADAFAELIATDNLNIVTVYGGEGVVDRVAHQNKDELTIKDGELIYNDPQVNPPEVETGLNAEMLNYGNFEYNYNECKEGFLEYIDWDNADKDYLTAHFHAFYDQMAWFIDEWSMDNWLVYKLSNDTYLYSKSYSYYSEGWNARVFTGQSFVIKRNGDDYGIVAYIDAL